MKVKERKGWKDFNKCFENWYQSENCPNWKIQKQWLSRELIKRNFIKNKQLLTMWITFDVMTSNCSFWSDQSRILSFITVCMNEDEDLADYIK